MAASTLVLLFFSLLFAQTLWGSAGAKHRPWVSWNASEPSLQYYVQVVVGVPYTGVLVPPLNSTVTNAYGDTEALQFNITEGTSNVSKALGFVYGFTVQLSYTAVSLEVEVETVAYDDGAGVNGTFNLQGLIKKATNEIAVTGGTGSFRGVRGYVVISMINPNVYHHAVYFL